MFAGAGFVVFGNQVSRLWHEKDLGYRLLRRRNRGYDEGLDQLEPEETYNLAPDFATMRPGPYSPLPAEHEGPVR